MNVDQLKSQMEWNDTLMILDVREDFELEICSIKGAIHIPMGEVTVKKKLLPLDKDIVVVCHHGMRSAQVVNYLQSEGWSRVFNLEGGIHDWAVKIDAKMSRY